MILPESPKALAFDSTLAAWAVFVVTKGLPELIMLATFVTLILRVLILWREWTRG